MSPYPAPSHLTLTPADLRKFRSLLDESRRDLVSDDELVELIQSAYKIVSTLAAIKADVASTDAEEV